MKKPKILLIDDMEWVYESTRIKLEKIYDIDYAQTEIQARLLMNQNKYDLVISDYYLSKISPKGGLNLIKLALEKNLKAILMSKENHRKEAKIEGVEFIFKKNLVSYLEGWRENER